MFRNKKKKLVERHLKIIDGNEFISVEYHNFLLIESAKEYMAVILDHKKLAVDMQKEINRLYKEMIDIIDKSKIAAEESITRMENLRSPYIHEGFWAIIRILFRLY